VVTLALLLSELKINAEAGMMNVVKGNAVSRKIVSPPGAHGLCDAELRDGLAIVLTGFVQEVDLELAGAKLGQRPVVTEQLPAAEHVTEDVRMVLKSFPSHEVSGLPNGPRLSCRALVKE
jgi:hypothetical protein